MKPETESVLIFSWSIVAIIAVIIAFISLGQRVEAREGFYLMVGIGTAETEKLTIEDEQGNELYEWEWQDGGEAGCGIGAGVMWEAGDSFLFDLNYRHRSQCNYWGEDESNVDTLYLDLFWFPFQ